MLCIDVRYTFYSILDFTLKFIQEHGFNTPMLYKNKNGLKLKYVSTLCVFFMST